MCLYGSNKRITVLSSLFLLPFGYLLGVISTNLQDFNGHMRNMQGFTKYDTLVTEVGGHRYFYPLRILVTYTHVTAVVRGFRLAMMLMCLRVLSGL
jgi:hypothetical protein